MKMKKPICKSCSCCKDDSAIVSVLKDICFILCGLLAVSFVALVFLFAFLSA